MTDPQHLPALVAWCSFALAFVFGWVGNRTHFCTMGAVADIVTMGSWQRMRMWMLAMAVAILGATLLHKAGMIDLSKSIYQRSNLLWLSHLLGGFLFGIGMVLGSGCGSKTLIRVGGGNLKSLVVLVFLGISAYMTLKGLFGLLRRDWIDAAALNLAAFGLGGQDLPTLLGRAAGRPAAMLLMPSAIALAGALLVFIFKDAEFRAQREYILGGIVVGLLIPAGWYVTGHLGYAENPDTLDMTFFATNSRSAESFSFVAPVAYGLELLMLWSDKSLIVSFGVASTVGMILGSTVWALVSRTFRWEGFASVADLRNHIVGGLLMGFGGVTGLGCTIGQGISGLSTLALGSILTLLAIVAGAVAMLRYQTWQVMHET